jgi:UDP-galactopyranose mutase
VREYPQATGYPYYPIPRPDNEALFKRYAALAAAESNVYFVGRLAEYRYYNMDQVVAAALALAEKKLAVPPLEQSIGIDHANGASGNSQTLQAKSNQ